MIHLSHPEPAERAALPLSPLLSLSPSSPADPRDADTLTRLQNLLFTGPQKAAVPAGKYRAARIAGLSNLPGEYLSMYLNLQPGKKTTVNVATVEAKLGAWFAQLDSGEAMPEAAEPEPETAAGRFFPTAFTDGCAAFFRQVHKAAGIGALTAQPGSGKNAAKWLYGYDAKGKQKTGLIILEANKVGLSTEGELKAYLYRRLGIRNQVIGERSKHERLGDALVGGGYQIIADNAQRWRPGARSWFCDLWNRSNDAGKKLSIVFMGNEELLGVLSRNAQEFSRLLMTENGDNFWSISGGAKVAPEVTLEPACKGLVDLHFKAPLSAAQLRKFTQAATKLAAVDNGGRLRIATNVIQNAQLLMETPQFSDPWDAFRAAYMRIEKHLPKEKRVNLN